jgi:hypothetical protein
MPIGEKDQGAEGVAKGVTSTVRSHISYSSTPVLRRPLTDSQQQVGNLVGGVTKGVGGVVGAAGKGVGDTINNTTGTKAVGDGLQGVTGGIEDGAQQAGKGAENAGEWKK